MTCNLLPPWGVSQESNVEAAVSTMNLPRRCSHSALVVMQLCPTRVGGGSTGLWVQAGRVIGRHLGGTDGPGANWGQSRCGAQEREQGLETEAD